MLANTLIKSTSKNMRTWWQRLMAGICLVALLVVNQPDSAWALAHDKQTLVKADFSHQDLRDSDFSQSNMRDSTFRDSDLRGSRFFGTNLTAADMTNIDLTGGALDTARLTRTNLTNAILVGVFMTNTKFEGAIVDGADFTDVLLRRDQQLTLCKVAKGTNPKTGRQTRETLDCP